MNTVQFVTGLVDWLLADPSHIVTAAAAMAAIIPTPDPSTTWGKVYRIVDLFAINVLHAKETGVPAKAGDPRSPLPKLGTGAQSLAVLMLAGGLLLSACANQSDPTTVIVEVESGYGAALAAENSYLASGKADPAVVKTLANARIGVASVLDPIAAAAAKGTAPTSDQALAAQTALTAFQSALQANGLMPQTTTTTGSN